MNDNLLQLDEFYLDLQNDGRKINLLNEKEIKKRPFPGLRPFKTSETQLFFGREGQTEEVMKVLKANKFVAVLGNSGSGKSSLVRAGVLPALYAGYLGKTGSNWNIAICRPGKNPIVNLAVALSSSKTKSNNEKIIDKELKTILPMLQKNSYGILEYEKYLNANKPANERENLLVVVDQFEELFRFKREIQQSNHDAIKFVNQLLSAAQNRNTSIYVVITMRSEFLGDCVQFRGLPEIINKGQYLVPRLKRNEIKCVITEPLKLAGHKINPSLVNRLVDEVGDDMDQLPLLQHVLMRTYNYWLTKKNGQEIDHIDYESVGTIHNALGFHASEKINQLNSSEQAIAKTVFQRLTDKSSDERGIRRPSSFKEILEVLKSHKTSKNQVKKVINFLRDEDTSFIMPPANTRLQNELILDISHESLMRNWPLLKKWIEEEVDNSRLYKQLLTRTKYKEPIQGALLKVLINWERKTNKNAVWASRYHQLNDNHEKVYSENLKFLHHCDELEKNDQREKEKKRIVKFRLVSSAAIGLLILLIGSIWIGIEFKKQRDIVNNVDSILYNVEKQTKTIERTKKQAEKEKQEAKLVKQKAERERKEALEARIQSEKKKKEALLAKQKAEVEKNRAMALKKRAEQEKKKALADKLEAKKEKEEAILARAKAESEKKAAQLAQLSAEKEINSAEKLRKEAEIEKIRALEEKQSAELEKENAIKSKQEAEVAKEEAIKQKKEASEVKKRAELEKQEALAIRTKAEEVKKEALAVEKLAEKEKEEALKIKEIAAQEKMAALEVKQKAEIEKQQALVIRKSIEKEKQEALALIKAAENEKKVSEILKKEIEREKEKYKEIKTKAEMEKQAAAAAVEKAKKEQEAALAQRKNAENEKLVALSIKTQAEKEKKEAQNLMEKAQEEKKMADNVKKLVASEDKKYRAFLRTKYLNESWFRSFDQEDQEAIIDTFTYFGKNQKPIPISLKESLELLSKINDPAIKPADKIILSKNAKTIDNNHITSNHLNKILDGKLTYKNNTYLNSPIKKMSSVINGQSIFLAGNTVFIGADLKPKPIFKLGANQKFVGNFNDKGDFFVFNPKVDRGNLKKINIEGKVSAHYNFNPSHKVLEEKLGITNNDLLNSNNTEITKNGDQIAFFVNNHLVVCNLNGKIKMVSNAGESTKITNICFSEDGTSIAATTKNDKISIWKVESLETVKPTNTYYAPHAISSIQFSPSMNYVLISSGNNAILYNNRGRQKNIFRHSGKVEKSCFTTDGKNIITAEKNPINKVNNFHIWSIDGNKIKSFTWHQFLPNNQLYNVSPLANGQIVSTVDKEVYFWNTNAPELTENQIGTVKIGFVEDDED